MRGRLERGEAVHEEEISMTIRVSTKGLGPARTRRVAAHTKRKENSLEKEKKVGGTISHQFRAIIRGAPRPGTGSQKAYRRKVGGKKRERLLRRTLRADIRPEVHEINPEERKEQNYSVEKFFRGKNIWTHSYHTDP